MSQQAKPNDGNLVPAGRQALAPVAAANPLVSRGLADIAQGRQVLRRIEASPFDLQNAISHFFRGADWYKRHDNSRASKELEVAIRLFDEAVRLDSRNAFAYLHRAKAGWCKCIVDEVIRNEHSQGNCDVLESEKDDYAKAMKDFDDAIRLDPNNALAYVERGEARHHGYFSNGWIGDFDEAIRLDPNNAGWHALRGHASLEQKDYDKAIRDFTEAIRLNANNKPDVLIVFTKMEGQETLYDYYDYGNPTMSRGVRINLYRNLASAYRYRGRACYEKGDDDEALKDFNEAISLDPHCAVSYFVRGLAWYEKQDYDKAIRDFNEAIQRYPNVETFYHARGLAWYRKGDSDEAIKDFNKAIQRYPNGADFYHDRGRAWLLKGHADEAIKDFNKAIQLDPKYEPPQRLLKAVQVAFLVLHLQEAGERAASRNA